MEWQRCVSASEQQDRPHTAQLDNGAVTRSEHPRVFTANAAVRSRHGYYSQVGISVLNRG